MVSESARVGSPIDNSVIGLKELTFWDYPQLSPQIIQDQFLEITDNKRVARNGRRIADVSLWWQSSAGFDYHGQELRNAKFGLPKFPAEYSFPSDPPIKLLKIFNIPLNN
jgi:hypothetical protein